MELSEYQSRAHQTTWNVEIGDSRALYPLLGLLGEAGELANKIKKVYRDRYIPDDKDIKAEMGDILWYLSEMATQMGYNLNDIAEENLVKLAGRQERGVIHGSGDNR